MSCRGIESMVVLASVLLGGCVSLAPAYRTPAAPVAQAWDAGSQEGPEPGAIGWRSFFLDERLQRVVGQSLANNRDLRVAILNVEKSRAVYHVQHAAQLPTIAAIASQADTRTPPSVGSTIGSDSGSAIAHVDSIEVGFSSFELDVFGRVRSLKDEALEKYLGSMEARRAVQLSVVAEVGADWLTLAADMRLLELAKKTVQSQQGTLLLVLRKHALGAVSGLDVAQAQSGVQAARADVATYTATVAQARNALDFAVGAHVADVDLPNASVDPVSALERLSAGVPSTVLAQRPDVRAAEHVLKASNADIGAARANFFPRISLTASAGGESDQLSALFQGGSRAWSVAPTISLPIFDAGANRANLDAAKAQEQIDLVTYELTIQTAFREVADALATRATIAERLDAEQGTVDADQRSYELSMALYQRGRYSFLDTLFTQRALYSAQQAQVAAQLAAQTSLVTLYKALGGGWVE